MTFAGFIVIKNILLFSSLKEFLPHHYMRVNKIEKKIFQEHKKLQGTSEVDTKVKYVKLARGLPTFGVHFFLVKVGLNFHYFFHTILVCF